MRPDAGRLGAPLARRFVGHRRAILRVPLRGAAALAPPADLGRRRAARAPETGASRSGAAPALRAGAGEETESPGDEAAEPARVSRGVRGGGARALGTRSANARFDETRARNEMMARLRGELLAPLAARSRAARGARAMPRRWRPSAAPATRRPASVAFDAEDASTAIRLVALVAEARAFEKARSKKRFPLAALVRFPFLETLEHSRIRDEDIATVFSTTLSTLTSTLASRTSIDADAIAVASNVYARRRRRCAARRAPTPPRAPPPAPRRARGRRPGKPPGRNLRAGNAGVSPRAVCALAGTLANRLTVASKTKTKEPSVRRRAASSRQARPGAGRQADDADAATRDAAAAALAALAAAAPLARVPLRARGDRRALRRRGRARGRAPRRARDPRRGARGAPRGDGGGGGETRGRRGGARGARRARRRGGRLRTRRLRRRRRRAGGSGLLPYARFREARDSDATRAAPGEATEEARRRDAPTALFGLD